MSAQALLRRLLTEEFGLKDAVSLNLGEALRNRDELAALDDERLAVELSARPSLRRELAATFSVCESYFFRHLPQAQAIVERVSTRLADGARTVIWSAGCARGEEPYTIAMQLLDQLGSDCRKHVSIIATDIDGRALQHARSGRFGAWSMRATPPDVVARYFHVGDEGNYQLSRRLLDWPELHHLSIQEHLALIAAGSVDIVLFRNVGLYLTPEALTSIHAGFSRVLRSGGLLCQSITDPLPPAALFSPFINSTTGLYRLAKDHVSHSQSAHHKKTAPKKATGKPTARLAGPAHTAADRGKSHRAALHAGDSGGAERALAEASLLADSGRNELALGILERLLQTAPTTDGAYLLRAQILLQSGQCDAAAADLRAALLLKPADCIARYWYIIALETAGRADEAACQRRVILTELERRMPSEQLCDGVTTVAQMRALVTSTPEQLVG